MLVEVVGLAGLNVLPEDRYELVAVLAALLVPQADGMADLMDGGTSSAVGGDVDVLGASLPSDPRGTLVGIAEDEPLDIRRLPRPERKASVVVPVRDGLLNRRVCSGRQG